MIEIKTVEAGVYCRVDGELMDVVTDGAACVGAMVASITSAYGENPGRVFVDAIRKVLEDEEVVNAIIREGIEDRRAAAQ